MCITVARVVCFVVSKYSCWSLIHLICFIDEISHSRGPLPVLLSVYPTQVELVVRRTCSASPANRFQIWSQGQGMGGKYQTRDVQFLSSWGPSGLQATAVGAAYLQAAPGWHGPHRPHIMQPLPLDTCVLHHAPTSSPNQWCTVYPDGPKITLNTLGQAVLHCFTTLGRGRQWQPKEVGGVWRPWLLLQ